jgi:hypothetical protein
MISWYEIDGVDVPQASALRSFLIVLMVGAVAAFAVVSRLVRRFNANQEALGRKLYVQGLARLVPVVNRADSRNLEGVISSAAVLKKYRR